MSTWSRTALTVIETVYFAGVRGVPCAARAGTRYVHVADPADEVRLLAVAVRAGHDEVIVVDPEGFDAGERIGVFDGEIERRLAVGGASVPSVAVGASASTKIVTPATARTPPCRGAAASR